MFRQQQLRKFFSGAILNRRVRIKELLKSYLKSITAYCISLLGMDNLMIRRRNIAFEDIKEQNILKNILNIYEKNNLIE